MEKRAQETEERDVRMTEFMLVSCVRKKTTQIENRRPIRITSIGKRRKKHKKKEKSAHRREVPGDDRALSFTALLELHD